MPNQTMDQPCDVILVVKDCKEFKAHRQVLSEASPFFEKLLNSDMKESKEGIIRFEMFSEAVMATALQFIYTGHVQILDEDNARDLVTIADYLFLQKLKTLAEGVLLHELNISNCMSTHHFAQIYQCEELFAKSKKIILANFSALYKANRGEFLNMSNKEIEMWISSDDINVNAEEDVFNIILTWIDHDKSKRKKYFVELFRHVRLVCVSRDFLCYAVVTNDMVKENEGCLDLVKDALSLIDSRNYADLPVRPRKSLEIPVVITASVLLSDSNCSAIHTQDILCYFPHEDKWCKIDKMHDEYLGHIEFVYWCGKLYTHGPPSRLRMCKHRLFPQMLSPLLSYNLYSNSWTTLPYEDDRELRQVFTANEDELYALASDRGLRDQLDNWPNVENCVYFIMKYKPDSDLWEEIASFDHLNINRLGSGFCVIAKDNFIYIIGGRGGKPRKYLTDVHRYDLNENKWDKVADMPRLQYYLTAAPVNGKIFVAGRIVNLDEKVSEEYQCEVYNDAMNEWQFIKTFDLHHEAQPRLLSVDDKLYVLGTWVMNKDKSPDKRVECYDPDKDEWQRVTEVPVLTHPISHSVVNVYSARIFKGFLTDSQLGSIALNAKTLTKPA